MPHHAAAQPERAGVHEDAAAAKGEAFLVLRQTGAGDINGNLRALRFVRRACGHRHRRARRLEVTPHALEPQERLLLPVVLPPILPARRLVVAPVKQEMLRLLEVANRRILLRRVGLVFRGIRHRRDALRRIIQRGLELQRMFPVLRRERFQRIIPPRKILAQQLHARRGKLMVLANHTQKRRPHRGRKVREFLRQFVEMPVAKLPPFRHLHALQIAERMSVERTGRHTQLLAIGRFQRSVCFIRRDERCRQIPVREKPRAGLKGGLLLCKQRGVESREKKKDASYHEEVT